MYGAVALLSSGTLHSDAAEEELLRLREGIDVMICVTNDLLDAEALRLGRLRVRPVQTDLRSCLARCLPRSTATNPTMLGIAAGVPAEVILDPLRLRQVRCYWMWVVRTTTYVHHCASARPVCVCPKLAASTRASSAPYSAFDTFHSPHTDVCVHKA
jgi:hypothetical protein